MKYFENVRVYLEGVGIKYCDLRFSNWIAGTGKGDDGEAIGLPDDALVLPGFLDEHIHGAGGADAMDASGEALSTISRTLAEEGTTSFLATTMTQSKEEISNALAAVDEYIRRQEGSVNRNRLTEYIPAVGRQRVVNRNGLTGARLLGAHLEGPFISAAHKGAQPLEFVAPPNVEQFARYDRESGGTIRIVTLAPEEEGADELISYLDRHGILPSIGHTGAKWKDVERAVACGAKHVTHTYNAQSPLHHREIGTVGSALLLDELWCELICDGIHVSVPAMKLLVKNKPKDKLILITDAIRAKGLADGESELGGQKVFVKNGEARLADGTLAGSVLRMNRAVKNLIELVGVPVTEAVDCATINPAKSLGLDGELGSIAPGKRADFAVVNSDFDVLMTVRDGQIVYQRQ